MAAGRATGIHLIENDGRIRPIDVSADLYESGFWVVGDDLAEELKGGDIYFHNAQAAPSYLHNLEEAQFTGADLTGANLTASRAKRTNFTNADLSRMRWDARASLGGWIYASSFVNANLDDAYLAGLEITRCDFAGASLNRTDVLHAILGASQGIDLTNAVNADTIRGALAPLKQ